MKQEYALVILAAGIGSRFGKGIKQIEKVGPSGEIIIDYSIHDAVEAGFNKIVFIIRHSIEQDFREVIGDRVTAWCGARGVEVAYAFQEVEDLPAPFVCPSDRTKPWGTTHALLACRGLLKGPFAVINADDYYGREVYAMMFSHLQELGKGSTRSYCMAGYLLSNTLSEFGSVNRGICTVDQGGFLRNVVETAGIVKTPSGAAVRDGDVLKPIDSASYASMNFWGFTVDILDLLEEKFRAFLAEKLALPKSECLIPVEIGVMLQKGECRVKLYPTDAKWFGMTYQEDVPVVKDRFRALVEAGVYSENLYA